MKALDQIEPRTIVNAANTPGDASSLFKITQSGSYYLTGNIQGVPGKHGIFIASDNVTIDLKGFAVIGAGPGNFDGITLDQEPFVSRRNVTVVNGTLRNWGRDGLNAIFGGSNCIYRELRFSNNGRHGLSAVSAAVVNCVALENQNNGFVAYNSTTVTGCSAQGNGTGFTCVFGAMLSNCSAFANGTGVYVGEGAIATNCMIRSNSAAGLALGPNAVALNNAIDSSGGKGIAIFFGGTGGRIEGNTLTRNGDGGINLTGGSGWIVLRNTARGNTGGNYLMGTNNSYGPIVNVAGVGDISATTGANHPSANFSY